MLSSGTVCASSAVSHKRHSASERKGPWKLLKVTVLHHNDPDSLHDLLTTPSIDFESTWYLSALDVSALREHGLIDARRNALDREILRLESSNTDADDEFTPSLTGYYRLARKLLRKTIPVVDHTSTILSLKSQRNELAPISILPPESLAHVFSFCVPRIRDPFWASRHSIQGSDWIECISHICRQWRDISLGSPRLWTYLTPTYTAWMEEMLFRSKEAPLLVHADFLSLGSESPHIESISLALQRLSRIRRLSLNITDWSLINEALSQPAPLLVSFDLGVFRRSPPFLLPEPIFSGTAPSLSRLALDGCYLRWDSSLYNNITHLRLSRIKTDLTMPQFLALLARMKLRALNLRAAIPSLPLDVMNAPEAQFFITLPYLTLLSLNGPALDCAHLLNHLRMPQNPTLRLVFDIRNLTADSNNGILPSVARHCRTNAFRGLMIEKFSESGLRIQAWPTTDVFHRRSGHTDTNEPSLSLRITSKTSLWPTGMFLSTITEVCSTLPLQDLRVLRWDSLNLETPWRECMRYLRSVETLFVDDDSVHGLLAYLEGNVPRVEVKKKLYADGEGSSGSDIMMDVSFPALETLVCRGASFGEVLAKEGRMKVLREWLEQRKGLGLELKALHFRHCQGLTTVDLAGLKDLVPEVLWVQRSKDDDGEVW